MGGTDQRKLTVLLYLQPPGSYNETSKSLVYDTNPPQKSPDTNTEEIDPRGGYFRAYNVPKNVLEKNKKWNKNDIISTDNTETTNNNIIPCTWIGPVDGRLVMFWSDTLLHDVSESFILTNDNPIHDRRWALTTWLISDTSKGGTIFS
jgi:hypothetical protein